MGFFRKLIRNILASFALSVPNFEHGKEEVNDHPVEPITDSKHQFKAGGALEAVDKYYGRTVAGGPGSQKIGDTFNALPQAERDAMIAARKGIVRQQTPEEKAAAEASANHVKGYRFGESGTDKIARALASGRYNYRGGRKP